MDAGGVNAYEFWNERPDSPLFRGLLSSEVRPEAEAPARGVSVESFELEVCVDGLPPTGVLMRGVAERGAVAEASRAANSASRSMSSAV